MKMSIKSEFIVEGIPKQETYSWLLNKHYAHRIPPISYAFGLFDKDKILQGVCTFGMPCRKLFEYWIDILELNRLIINEGLPKNTLSFFVSQSLKRLPMPNCIVSYADDNQGHHGYIYQATNWIYTGLSSSENKVFIDGKLIHRRTLNSIYKTSSIKELKNNNYNVEIEEQVGKHRYFKFIGNKKQIIEMYKKLTYSILPYPKGNNQRYDIGKPVAIQTKLF